jgi:hypothetical protein
VWIRFNLRPVPFEYDPNADWLPAYHAKDEFDPSLATEVARRRVQNRHITVTLFLPYQLEPGKPVAERSPTNYYMRNRDYDGEYDAVYCRPIPFKSVPRVVERIAVQDAMTSELVSLFELPEELTKAQERSYAESKFPDCSFGRRYVDGEGNVTFERTGGPDLEAAMASWQNPDSICRRNDVDYVERYRNGPGKEVRRPGSGICDVDQSLVPLYEALNPHYLAWLRGALDD